MRPRLIGDVYLRTPCGNAWEDLENQGDSWRCRRCGAQGFMIDGMPYALTLDDARAVWASFGGET